MEKAERTSSPGKISILSFEETLLFEAIGPVFPSEFILRTLKVRSELARLELEASVGVTWGEVASMRS